MRKIALTMIVIIVGGIVLTKMYKKDDADTTPPDSTDTRTLTEALEGSLPQEETRSEVVEEPVAEPAEVADAEPVEEETVNVVEEQIAPDPTVQEDTTSEEARQLIEEAIELRKQGKVIAARGMLNHTLDLQLSPQIRSGVKMQLANLAKTWLFSKEVLAEDKLTGRYKVAPGDRLAIIAKNYKVPYEILMEINGIHRPELLQAGQNLKIVHGPFNAVVYKSNFTMDLYLQDKYIKTYRVGLGAKETETPSGHWRVKSGGKFDNKPVWRDEKTNKVYDGSHPDYPLGERYIAIEGLDEKTKDRSGFAIHGTKDPESIGKRESLGCIRMHNDDVIEVYEMLRSGVSEVWIMD
jgi:LysM repeat protein